MPELTGRTKIIAHIGDPTDVFKAPMIYNPYFDSIGLDVAVVPMGVTRENGPASLPMIFRMTNVIGVLITMPHKVDVVAHLDRVSEAVRVAGACNAVRIGDDGRFEGDMFDGEGFARGLERKGRTIRAADVLIVGAGGVGSAIAASVAARGPRRLGLFDVHADSAERLAARLAAYYPAIEISVGSNDAAGFDIVVNATPLGMKANDPLPFDPAGLSSGAFVGEVVMKQAETPLLSAAAARGCTTQPGIDMLFEMIPAYLEFFRLPVASPDRLRQLARIAY